MADWKDTPPDKLVTARRLNHVTGEWEACQYVDLKRSDIFRTYAGDEQINPLTMQFIDDPNFVAVALEDPVPAIERGCGYMVEIIAGPLDLLMKQIAN